MQCSKNELNLIEKQKQKEENNHAVHQFSAVSFSKHLFSLFIFFYKSFNAFNVYWVPFFWIDDAFGVTQYEHTLQQQESSLLSLPIKTQSIVFQ